VSTHSHEDYPEDEFDRAGRNRTPQGVHRAPRSVWRALLPVIAVVVLAPLLAWGAITLLGGTGGQAPSATATQEATAEPTETESAPAEEPTAETPKPTAEPTEEETTPAAPVDFTAGIVVLNGAGINGLAGNLVGELSSAGFNNSVAADYGAAAPDVTTLYYNNAELAATAQQVGEVLGIANIVESASATSSTDIAVVVRADYAG
jgi:hypothetical protein